jgi:Na+/proline symporter
MIIIGVIAYSESKNAAGYFVAGGRLPRCLLQALLHLSVQKISG